MVHKVGLVSRETCAYEQCQLTKILSAGVLANVARPPATPKSLAAMFVLMIADKFGASTFILDST